MWIAAFQHCPGTAKVRPEQAFIEAHWTVAKAKSGPSLATPVGPESETLHRSRHRSRRRQSIAKGGSGQSLLAASTEKRARRFEATRACPPSSDREGSLLK